MKSLILLLCASFAARAITCSISTPTASSTISGEAFSVTAAVAADTNHLTGWMAYYLDGELPRFVSIAGGTTFAYSLNTWNFGNTGHRIYGQVLDAQKNVLATCPTVSFSIHNNIPINGDTTVTPSQSIASAVSGVLTLTPTTSGSGTLNSWSLTVDGFWDGVVYSNGATRPNQDVYEVNTAYLSNGSHRVSMVPNYTGENMSIAPWDATITVSNSVTPIALKMDSREAYVAPSGTVQMATPVYINNDGTTGSVTTVKYFSDNTSICTVNSTGLVTGVAFGVCNIYALATSPSVSTVTLTRPQAPSDPSFWLSQTECRTKVPTGTGKIYVVTGTGEVEQGFTGTTDSAGTGWNCDGTGDDSFGVSRGLFGTTAGSYSTSATFTVALWTSATVWVQSNNVISNICQDNTIVNNYQSCSAWMANQFADWSNVNDFNWNNTAYFAARRAGGFNTFETSMFIPFSTATAEATFDTSLATNISNFTSVLTGTGFKARGITQCNNPYWNTTYPTANWVTPLWNKVYTSWKNTGMMWGSTGCDEVESSFGGNPFPAAAVNAGGPFTSIVGNGVTCTVHWTSWTLDGSGNFLISGATTHSALNTSSPYLSLYHGSTVDTNTFTFPCSMNATADSSSDAGLTIQIFGTQQNDTNTAYAPYNVFQTMRSQISAVTGAAPLSEPVSAAANNAINPAVTRWQGSGSMSDFAESYVSICTPFYMPYRYNIRDVACAMDQHRLRINLVGATKPLITEQAAIATNYWAVKRTQVVSVTSCAGNLFTFSADHGVRNVIAGVTRMTVTGNTDSNCNGNFFFLDAPTPTTAHVYRQVSLIATGSGSGGTFTFQNGHTYSISNTMSWNSTNWNNSRIGTSGTFAAGDFGVEFAVSGGTYGGSVTAARWLLLPQPAAGTSNYFIAQIPATSEAGTGGTATISPDVSYVSGGTKNVSPYGGNLDLDFVTADILASAAIGSTGIRAYTAGADSYGHDSHGWNYSTFALAAYAPFNQDGSDTPGGAMQSGVHPRWEDGSGESKLWSALGYGNLFAQRFVTYIFQPRCLAPDWGQQFQMMCRGTLGGNVIIGGVNLSLANASVTVTLTPYLVGAGQKVLRYLVSGHGILPVTELAANTSTDTVTVGAGQALYYVFPSNEASEYSASAMKVSLTGSEHDAVVLWSYQPDVFLNPLVSAEAAPNATLLTAGSGTIAWDGKIGPFFYQVQKVDVNGAPLNQPGPGDVMCIGSPTHACP